MASTINSDETASCLWRWPKEYSDKPQPQDHLADLLQKPRTARARLVIVRCDVAEPSLVSELAALRSAARQAR